MIRYTKILLIGFVFVLTSCFNEEEFPDTPRIEFVALEYADSPTTDSLILTFSFEDGGANIGTLGNDFSPQYDLFVDSEPKVLTADNLDQAVPPIFLAPIVFDNVVPVRLDGNTITILPDANSYPAFIEDEVYTEDVNDITLNCPNVINETLSIFDSLDVAVYELTNPLYELITLQSINSEVPALIREDYNNLRITFERIVNGEPQEIDFNAEFPNTSQCVDDFDARIPLFDQNGTSGTISYSMISAVLDIPLAINPFRVRFQVVDRLGNVSNEVVTPTYLLSEITRITN